MDFKFVKDHLNSLEDVIVDKTFKDGLTGFNVKIENQESLFALLKNSQPVQISLRCDRQLSDLLRTKYETVMPGQNLNPKQWNTIILTGQLPWEDIKGLITLSYNLAKELD